MLGARADGKDYLNAALITLGCTLFLMTGSVKSKHASADSSVFGLLLMLGYLGFDGFTSTFQDKLFKVGPGRGRQLPAGQHPAGATRRCGAHPLAQPSSPDARLAWRPSPPLPPSRAPQGFQMTIYNQILYVTTFSATFSLLGLISAGQLMPAIRSGCRAAGQG